jgi:hypothetical protein
MTEETLADQVLIGDEQLDHRVERIREIGVTADDLELVADYLRALAEHGEQVAHLARRAFEEAPRSHLVRLMDEAGDVELYLQHAHNLFEAAQTFSSQAFVLIRDANAS